MRACLGQPEDVILYRIFVAYGRSRLSITATCRWSTVFTSRSWRIHCSRNDIEEIPFLFSDAQYVWTCLCSLLLAGNGDCQSADMSHFYKSKLSVFSLACSMWHVACNAMLSWFLRDSVLNSVYRIHILYLLTYSAATFSHVSIVDGLSVAPVASTVLSCRDGMCFFSLFMSRDVFVVVLLLVEGEYQ